MKGVVLAILKKEMREVLRDKRTLFLALFVPLLFYPVLMGVSLAVSDNAQVSTETDTIVVVGIDVPEELEVIEGVKWIEMDKESLHQNSLPEGAVAAAVFERGEVTLYSSVSPQSQLAKQRMLNVLDEVHEQGLIKQLGDLGVAPAVTQFSVVQHVALLPRREEVGRQIGGVAAYFMIFLAYTGCMSVAVDAGAGERERGTMEAMMASSASFLGIALGKFIFVVVMGCLSVVATFAGLACSVLFDSEVSTMVLRYMDVGAVCMLAILMFWVVVLFASLLYSIALLAKSSREAHLRASLVMMVLAVILIISGSSMFSQATWVYCVPVMNLAITIADVVAGEAEIHKIILTIAFSFIVSLLTLFLVSIVFKRLPERSYLSE